MRKTLFSNLIVAIAALMMCGVSYHAQAQRYLSEKVTLSQTTAKQLLTTGDAATLRAKFIGKNEADAGAILQSEKYSDPKTGTSVELIAQTLKGKVGTVEQIYIKITEAKKVSIINLAQNSDGSVSELRGTNLVTYSLSSSTNNAVTCINQLIGAGSSCASCKAKLINCIQSNNTFRKRLGCFLDNIDGSCALCGLSLTLAILCLRG